jgi:hypothetical protein
VRRRDPARTGQDAKPSRADTRGKGANVNAKGLGIVRQLRASSYQLKRGPDLTVGIWKRHRKRRPALSLLEAGSGKLEADRYTSSAVS